MSVQFHKADPVEVEFQFRAMPDGSSTFEGYAAVFNKPSKPIFDELARGRPYRETIAPGAFRSTIGTRRQTFVVDHNEKLMISYLPGGPLRMAEDSTGLHVESPWPRTDYADNVRALHEAGNPLGMSMLFGVPPRNARRPTERPPEEWSPDSTARTVNTAVLKHVSVLATLEPAYDGTVAHFRALATTLDAEIDDLEALFDGIREDRPLTPGESNLLDRLAAHYRPSPPEPDPVVAVPENVLAVLAKIDADLPRT